MLGFLSILVGLCVTAGVILLFASANYRKPRLWRGIASFLLAIPVASMTYLFLGIRLARAHGLSRFYSWPFGGAAISDGNIGLSAAFWMLVWFVFLFFLFSIFRKASSVDKRR